ncbi:Phage excisionase |uniref:Phage excisionase \|nr:DUF2637 domain-containing protein [Microbacterium esteraromaticum]SJN43425.1 Phage excisionase \
MSETRPHRTARVSPDRFWVAILAIVLVTVIMVASFVFSYVAIMDSGRWAGAVGWVQALAPLFIDGAIVTYTLALAIYESRGEDRKVRRRTRRRLWAYTLASVVLNAAHAAAFWDWDFSRMEAWFGVLIAVLAPLAALGAAEEVMHLAFVNAEAQKSEGPSEEADDEAEATHETLSEAPEEDWRHVLATIEESAGEPAGQLTSEVPVVVGGAFLAENGKELRDDEHF